VGRSELGSEFVVEGDGLRKRWFTEAGRTVVFYMAGMSFGLQAAMAKAVSGARRMGYPTKVVCKSSLFDCTN